jgi:hypothetical protein
MKTATILFYVSPSLESLIKNARTIDLMEVEKDTECTDSEMNPCDNGVENSGDIDVDGEEGNADGYRGDSNLHEEDKDDNKDDEEEDRSSSLSLSSSSSSSDESSGSSDSSSGTG